MLFTTAILGVGLLSGNPILASVQAMLRAFRQAITHLEQAWWQTSRGRQMRRDEPETARITSEAFRQLEKDACAFCAPDHSGRAAGNDQVRTLLYGDAASARSACSTQLANYLLGYDPQPVAFIEKRLVGELAVWFGKVLKADRPESNRAWRAFQRLLLEGLQTALTDMRAKQQETKQQLRDPQPSHRARRTGISHGGSFATR
jgi:hypothetical protein